MMPFRGGPAARLGRATFVVVEDNLDHVPLGLARGQNDNMILNMHSGASASGHPTGKGGISPDEIVKHLADEIPTQNEG